MNKRVKKKWVQALRSGKYKQTIGQLYDDGDGFCCLGVLCDLHRKENKQNSWAIAGDNKVFYLGAGDTLPPAVIKWAGLTYRDPKVDKQGTISLSGLNDSGSSFGEIADIIEDQL